MQGRVFGLLGSMYSWDIGWFLLGYACLEKPGKRYWLADPVLPGGSEKFCFLPEKARCFFLDHLIWLTDRRFLFWSSCCSHLSRGKSFAPFTADVSASECSVVFRFLFWEWDFDEEEIGSICQLASLPEKRSGWRFTVDCAFFSFRKRKSDFLFLRESLFFHLKNCFWLPLEALFERVPLSFR